MAVQVDLRYPAFGPTSEAASLPLPHAIPGAHPHAIPGANPRPKSRLARRKLQRRLRTAAEAAAWLAGSAFLTAVVLGGLAGLH